MKTMDLKKKVHIWDYIFNNILIYIIKLCQEKEKILKNIPV